jgi:hypothetical protein
MAAALKKKTPLVLILSQTNTVSSTQTHPLFPTFILMSSAHLRFGLASGLFPSGLPNVAYGNRLHLWGRGQL